MNSVALGYDQPDVMTTVAPRIFISYRRRDSNAAAWGEAVSVFRGLTVQYPEQYRHELAGALNTLLGSPEPVGTIRRRVEYTVGGGGFR